MPDKKREQYHLTCLRKCISELPSDDPQSPDPPDFVFTMPGGHRLGIELTTFHLLPEPGKRPHQEQQSLKDRIVDVAEKLHAQSGGPALYVHVIFHERHPLAKKDTQPFARELADAILRHPVPLHYTEPHVKLPYEHKPKWAAVVSVSGSVDGSDKLWQADAGGWVAQIASEDVSKVIKNKATRERLARTHCDELWLVIVNDVFNRRAAQAEISADARERLYEGPFDRLIWLLPHVPRIIDLKLKKRTH